MATTIKRQDVADAVWQILEKSKSPKQAAQAVAGYLIAERRTKELPALLRLLEERQLKVHDRMEVTATSAVELNDSTRRAIKQLFGAKDVVLHEEINTDVVGGVRVRALDKVADFSVQARLRQLRQGHEQGRNL